MCRLLGLPFELRAPNGLIGADAETKQSPFLRMNPLGQVRAPEWLSRPACTRVHVC